MSRNDQLIISREEWQNFKDYYHIPSYKKRYLDNVRKRESKKR